MVWDGKRILAKNTKRMSKCLEGGNKIVTEVTVYCEGEHKSLILIVLHYCPHSTRGVKWMP